MFREMLINTKIKIVIYAGFIVASVTLYQARLI
jgi:hypothetical protein